jgi:hypothetical protein
MGWKQKVLHDLYMLGKLFSGVILAKGALMLYPDNPMNAVVIAAGTPIIIENIVRAMTEND